MLDKNKRFKIILGTLVPLFVILLTTGFCLLMIGYRVGSQDDEIKIMWTLVTSGWIILGMGLAGYFTMFAIVLVRRHINKKKQSPTIAPQTEIRKANK